MLFNEPKLLKSSFRRIAVFVSIWSFSALQRAEIAEIGAFPQAVRSRFRVSVLFNEPKLLKCFRLSRAPADRHPGFSALQRAEIAEMPSRRRPVASAICVSVLFNEPKLLKSTRTRSSSSCGSVVSVLFNEPKLLKFARIDVQTTFVVRFSALQRAEIAEI